MIKKNLELKSTIMSIHDTMKAAKTGLKNPAILQNITNLKPVMDNMTRWSSKCDMLKRFIRIRDDLLKVNKDDDGEIPMDDSTIFLNKTKKFESMLSEINFVNKTLQTKHY